MAIGTALNFQHYSEYALTVLSHETKIQSLQVTALNFQQVILATNRP